jgi:hypothetical protein
MDRIALPKLATLFVIGTSLLACGLFNPITATPDVHSTITTELPPPSPTEEEAPGSTEPSGRAEANSIQVDYVYTSNLITIIYPLYGSILDDFVSVTLTNGNNEAVRILIESEIIGYTTRCADTVMVDGYSTLEVRQNPLLIPEVIDQLNVGKPAQFHLRVVFLDNGVEKPILDETGETQVYARRDYPFSIPGFTEEEVFEMLAAMSTPNDPAVEELIRAAADYTESGIITSGYSGHPDDEAGLVWDRLQAIWRAEEEIYNLTYISTWVSFAPGSVQRIRLPAEVLEQRSGNCIELALLYAAAAEAMDMEVAIIGIPGHAYVGVRTDMENANYYFIETTLIGRATFDRAVELGNQEFEEAQPGLEAREEGYGWVTIQDAREKGILPLPWQ